MTRINTEGFGTAHVADEVIAVIAGTAALETSGVAGLAKHRVSDLGDRSVRKHMAKAIGIDVTGEDVSITVEITVRMGRKLHEVAREVQSKVKTAVETMTGLNVTGVHISVNALAGEAAK